MIKTRIVTSSRMAFYLLLGLCNVLEAYKLKHFIARTWDDMESFGWTATGAYPLNSSLPSTWDNFLEPLDKSVTGGGVWMFSALNNPVAMSFDKFTGDNAEFCDIKIVKVFIKYFADNATMRVSPCIGANCDLDPGEKVEWLRSSEGSTIEVDLLTNTKLEVEILALPGGFVVFDQITITYLAEICDTTTTSSSTQNSEKTTQTTIETSTITDNIGTSTVTDTLETSTVTDTLETSTDSDTLETSTVTDTLETSTVTDTLETSTVTDTAETSTVTDNAETSTVTDTMGTDTSTSTIRSETTTQQPSESSTTSTDSTTSAYSETTDSLTETSTDGTDGTTLSADTKYPSSDTETTSTEAVIPPIDEDSSAGKLSLKEILLWIVLPVVLGLLALLIALCICCYRGCWGKPIIDGKEHLVRDSPDLGESRSMQNSRNELPIPQQTSIYSPHPIYVSSGPQIVAPTIENTNVTVSPPLSGSSQSGGLPSTQIFFPYKHHSPLISRNSSFNGASSSSRNSAFTPVTNGSYNGGSITLDLPIVLENNASTPQSRSRNSSLRSSIMFQGEYTKGELPRYRRKLD